MPRINARFAFAALLIGCVFFLSMRIPTEPDFFQHISLGQELLSSPSLVSYDHWSYTAYGERWLRYTFLYSIVLALLYDSIGLFGVWLFQAVTLSALAALMWRYRQSRALRPWENFLLFLIVFFEMYNRFNFRGENLGYLLFFIELLWLGKTLREGRRLHWSFPLFLLAWQSFHTSSYLGLAPYGFYAFLAAIKRRSIKPLFFYLATLCLLFFAHPDSYHLHFLPLQGIEFHRFLPVHELLPPVGARHTFYWIVFFITVLGIVFHKFRKVEDQTRLWPRRFWLSMRHAQKFFPLLCFSFFLLFSLGVSRAIPFALICSLPFLHRGARFIFEMNLFGRLPLVIAAGILALVFFLRVGFDDYSPGRKLHPRFHPAEVADFILKERPPGNLYHPILSAAYLSWRFKGNPRVFIDFRVDLYVRLIKELVAARKSTAAFRAILAKYNIQCAVEERAEYHPTEHRIFADWILVYRDAFHDIRVNPDCKECVSFIKTHKVE